MSAKDRGELVWVKVGKTDTPAYIVLNHESPPGMVYVEWATRGDRHYVPQVDIQQMTSRRGRRSSAPPPPAAVPKKKATKPKSRAKSMGNASKKEEPATKKKSSKKVPHENKAKDSQEEDEGETEWQAEETNLSEGSLKDLPAESNRSSSYLERNSQDVDLDRKPEAAAEKETRKQTETVPVEESEQSNAPTEKSEQAEAAPVEESGRTEAPAKKSAEDSIEDIPQQPEEPVEEDSEQPTTQVKGDEAKQHEASQVQQYKETGSSPPKEVDQPESPLTQESMEAIQPQAPVAQSAQNGSTKPRKQLLVELSSDDDDDYEDEDLEASTPAKATDEKRLVSGIADIRANSEDANNNSSASVEDEKKGEPRELPRSGLQSPTPPRIEEPESASQEDEDEEDRRIIVNRKRPYGSISEEAKSSSKDDRIFSCAKTFFVKSDKMSTTVGDIIRGVEAELGVSFGHETKQRIQRYLRQLALTWKFNHASRSDLQENQGNGERSVRRPDPLPARNGRIEPSQNGVNG